MSTCVCLHSSDLECKKNIYIILTITARPVTTSVAKMAATCERKEKIIVSVSWHEADRNQACP